MVAISQTLAEGGTSSYLNDGEYAAVLESIEELDITFFLCTNMNADGGAGTDSDTNGRLFTFLQQNAKFDEFMVIPGGEDDTDLFGDTNSSKAIAKYYNSGKVVVVHGVKIRMEPRNCIPSILPLVS